jgi:hypothetical protein
MSRLLLALVAALSLSVVPALAQSDAEVNTRIDTVLGDHTLYREAFDGIQTAINEDDATAFATWVSYPINVVADGETMSIADEEGLVAHFDSILIDDIRAVVADQLWQDVFVNDQGVMLGGGEVWLNGICVDDSCAAFDVKVIAIQSTSN